MTCECMKRKFEQVFEAVNVDNWEVALSEAEDFIQNVKNKFDEQILYMFFEDEVTVKNPGRYLLFAYSCELPDRVIEMLYALTKISRFLSVGEMSEIDFRPMEKFQTAAMLITDEEIEYLGRLSDKLNLSSLKFLSNLDLFIIQNYGVMHGIRQYFTYLEPVKDSGNEEGTEYGGDGDGDGKSENED